MSKEEAEKILNILKHADGGCVYCARELFKLFLREFPEFDQLAKKIFVKEFEEELEK